MPSAQTAITVNDAGDSSPTPGNCVLSTEGDCTLRAAIEEAETLGTDVDITLPDPNTVANNPAAQYAVDSGLGQLDVYDDGNTVTIDGAAGQAVDVIQAQCITSCEGISSRVLKVESGTTADISGVTIEDGDPSGGVGGGILDCGTMTWTDSTVTDNTAIESGGGIELSSGGSATLVGSTVSNNTQTDSEEGSGGGGIYLVGESDVRQLHGANDRGWVDRHRQQLRAGWRWN